ncbi:MAG TPA: helix-turn-helix transcriptional regulator [Thermomicrobiaceae bacterium]|nr:helix-turn-helix transcriptional regulator [Thermomicrobiaceae bacterium]
MTRDITFGDLLREMIEERFGPRSGATLAARLGVDPSLVRRWLRNARVPALDSPYLELIADALNLAPVERDELRRAQIDMLSIPPKERRRLSPAGQVRQLLNTGQQPHPQPAPRAATGPLQPAYYGPGALLRAFQDAVATLPPASGSEPPILVALAGPGTPRRTNEEVMQLWMRAFSRLLELGWDWAVVGGPRLPGTNRQLVNRVVQLASLGPGRFATYTLHTPTEEAGPRDLIVFPDFALIGIRVAAHDAVDGVLVVRGSEPRDLLCGVIERLRARAEQTLAVYPPNDLRVIEDVAELERLPGDRYHVKDGFRALTMPPAWLQGEGERLFPGDGAVSRRDFARVLALDRARLATFTDSIARDRWMDIASQQAIDELVRHGRFRTPDFTQQVTLSPAERGACLRRLIELLERYPNYHLALVGPEQLALLPSAAWAVKVGHGVIMRRQRASGDFNTVIMRQERLTAAFSAFFLEEMWGAIEPRHRERGWVIDYLRRALTLLGED